ncbi:MAG: class II aldolase/adducin family protein [Coriobacteriales bacterium]|jgi:L-fuculose-phosphate aldolase|nr:class II aldolase/adducin family protein [Coriobacteriales bacterium]
MAEFDFDKFTKDILDGLSSAAETVTDAASGAAESVGRYRDFFEIGRDLFNSGAVTSHGGNLSVSDGKTIWITGTGTRLGHLSTNSVVSVGWLPSNSDTAASIELKVHRAMYHALAERLASLSLPFTEAAIVHSHGLHTVYHSLTKESILPKDAEGLHLLGQSIPVLTPGQAIASDEVAGLMAQLVRHGASIAVVRGHGPFALADSMEKAYRLVSCLEYSASLLTLIG